MVPRMLPVAAVEQKSLWNLAWVPAWSRARPLGHSRRRDDAMWHYATLPLPPR
jgi:hypothetical protein